MGTRLTISEGLKLAIKRAGKNIAKISEEMGYKQRASITAMLSRGSIRADTMIEMAEKCGYTVKLVSADGDEIELKPEGGKEE